MHPSLVSSLRSATPTIAVELRPPKAELDASAGLEAWIDTYHAVRRLTHDETYVFLTDSAVGRKEEDNLRHLVANIGNDAPRARIVPFLTAKHPLDYCLEYANRAYEHGFRSIVVLGGDTSGDPPRCVEHAWMLRRMIRARQPSLQLGGWANPHKNPSAQVEFLLDSHVNADFFLTQVVSHHDQGVVERFAAESQRRRLALPGVFGVFYYRSANPRTLDALSPFLPVPREALVREFESGATPEDICARTIRMLRTLGIGNVYVSNLPLEGAARILRSILHRVTNGEFGRTEGR